MGCLRAAARFFLLATMAFLTAGLFRVIPGRWVWVGAGGCAVVSAAAFWLRNWPEEGESAD
jgi:hypothetical protein